ncbi:TolC family protein, partial [Novosphingobium sp. 1949]
AEAGVVRSARLAGAARANLARRTGLSPLATLDGDWLERVPPSVMGPVMGSAEDAVAPDGALGEGTLALAAAQADLALADAGVALARSQRVPDVTVGPGLRRLSQTGDTAFVVSLSLPIPLFNAGQAALAQAGAERTRAQAQTRMVALDVAQAITDARAEADNAAVSARASQGPVLAAAEEAARIARIGYREGKFGQLDLLDAERTLAQTRLAAIDALATYQTARALLERLTAPAPAPQQDD